MFSDKKVDININVPSQTQRPMTNINFERGILDIFDMAEDLDINGAHEELFKKLKSVVANYFMKGE